jgi:hypothetical protein
MSAGRLEAELDAAMEWQPTRGTGSGSARHRAIRRPMVPRVRAAADVEAARAGLRTLDELDEGGSSRN